MAIGDLDKDGVPEIVSIDGALHTFAVWHLVDDASGGPGAKKAEVIRTGVDINGDAWPGNCAPGSSGYTRGGGPPTVADFNGDGFADVALAGGVAYAVFDGKKLMDGSVTSAGTVLWAKKTQDCSSAATGSSIFDFDGDGKAEVVYADETQLHVYQGTDGADLASICNTSGTLYEYPLVADVDNDGQADLIVASNSYSSITCADGSKTTGIRVFGDENGKWVRTRRVWNQHTYHVTNVNEDGSIPAAELPNFSQPRLNNFRQNVQPVGEFSAPDLVVSLSASCAGGYRLIARVRNIGEAYSPPGIPVAFYLGDPASGGTLLGTGATTRALYPLDTEDVVLSLSNPPAAVTDGSGQLYARLGDGGAVPGTFHQCRDDNDTSARASGRCSGPR